MQLKISEVVPRLAVEEPRPGTRVSGETWTPDPAAGIGHAKPRTSVRRVRTGMSRLRGRDLLLLIILALLYIAAGRAGLQLDAVSGFATLVWAPSGIALAALLRFGLPLWPGVTAGALVVNLWAGAPLVAALGIATGNTLEPVLAVLLLRRLGFRGFTRVRDVVLLLAVGAAFSTTISATVGTLSLTLAGVVTSGRIVITWVSWWLGDAIADLIVAPLLFTWLTWRPPVSRRRLLEAAALAAVLLTTSLMVFTRRAPTETVVFLQPYLLTPALIWAALRFHERGAATAVFISSVIAVWATTAGAGPFQSGMLFQRLGALQALMAMMAITFLVLGAIASERTQTEHQLQRARETAEAASRAKSRFLAVVSHELRTPLTAVTGYADILLEGWAGQPNEQQRTHLQRIRAAGWHLISVIEGILTFSRAESGREEVRREDVDVAALAEESAALLAPEARKKSLQLQLTAPYQALLLRTDAGKLRQILLNLIGNAIKFSDTGTVDIAIERLPDRVQITVSDEGPGIPRDRLEEIFEPFTQLSGVSVGGTGLGLSASRMLAQLLGGSVTVKSEVGRGSKFMVQLPVQPAA
jgi:signal transduction histidine kinase